MIYLTSILPICLIAICLVGIVLIFLSEYKIDIKKKSTTPEEGIPTLPKEKNKVARVGKSMPDSRHMEPLGDSCQKARELGEKEDTFEPSQDESDSDPKDLVIDADPTESVMDEDEEIAAYTREKVYTAGGMDYEVMMNTVEVINSKTATHKDEQEVGKVLHDNRDTELVRKMYSSKGALSTRIIELLDLRTQEYKDSIASGVASHSKESDEQVDFKASDYF